MLVFKALYKKRSKGNFCEKNVYRTENTLITYRRCASNYFPYLFQTLSGSGLADIQEVFVQMFVKIMKNTHGILLFRGKTLLHSPSMFAVKTKIYGVLYNKANSIAFDETSSYWSALKSSWFLGFSLVTTR